MYTFLFLFYTFHLVWYHNLYCSLYMSNFMKNLLWAIRYDPGDRIFIFAFRVAG